MAYRKTSKAKKVWSAQAVAAKERKRQLHAEPRPMPVEDEITIEIKRKLTGEHVNFRLAPGDRCDNYRVYVDGRLHGIMGITKVAEGIRKALPRVRSEFGYN